MSACIFSTVHSTYYLLYVVGKKSGYMIKTYFISHQILATLSENATTAFHQKRPYSCPSELTVTYDNSFMKPPKRWSIL